MVLSDYYSPWPEAFAVPSTDAATIAGLLVDEILCRHGAPHTLLSDRGSNFLSKLVSEMCRIMNTRKLNTSAYHPQSDGLVERFNGILAQSLPMYVSSNLKDWDQHIFQVLYACRGAPYKTTGDSPFYLLYGREQRLPIDASLLPPQDLSSSLSDHRARIVSKLQDAQQLVWENTQRAQQRMKDQYDCRADQNQLQRW